MDLSAERARVEKPDPGVQIPVSGVVLLDPPIVDHFESLGFKCLSGDWADKQKIQGASL
jgi:hypothetical protein